MGALYLVQLLAVRQDKLSMPADRRADYKRKGGAESASDRRRRLFLERQKDTRRDLSEHARNLATGTVAEDDAGQKAGAVAAEVSMAVEVAEKVAEPTNAEKREARLVKVRDLFAKQLMTHDWLVDIPSDMNGKCAVGEGWFVLPRPEGKRCLVISSGGKTVSREQSGQVLHRFQSGLPSGSPGKGGDYSILDCVFHELDQTYYILDIMCWKGYSLYDCTAEFRFFWIHTKISEECDLQTVRAGNEMLFQTIPYYECDKQGLEWSYCQQCPFIRDGLLFFQKAAHYELGFSPLVLTFKDGKTSRYHTPKPSPNIVLVVKDGKLCTMDDISLGTVPDEFAQQHSIKEGDLLRFTIDGAATAEELQAEQPAVSNMQFKQKCPARRATADSWNKILCHCSHRQQVTVDLIAAAVIPAVSEAAGASVAPAAESIFGAAGGAAESTAPAQ